MKRFIVVQNSVKMTMNIPDGFSAEVRSSKVGAELVARKKTGRYTSVVQVLGVVVGEALIKVDDIAEGEE